MLSNFLTNISIFMNIDPTIIPNIITLIVVVYILYLSIKGSLAWSSLLLIYPICMAILSLLGIDSIFNLITLIGAV